MLKLNSMNNSVITKRHAL